MTGAWDIGAGRWRLARRFFRAGDVGGYAPGTVVLSVEPAPRQGDDCLAVWVAIPYPTVPLGR